MKSRGMGETNGGGTDMDIRKATKKEIKLVKLQSSQALEERLAPFGWGFSHKK